MNSLHNELNKNDIQIIGYIDVITILISGIIEFTLGKLMQSTLNITESWCIQNDLSINHTKTELLLFTTKMSTLFNEKLKLSKEVKYLGVTLDSKLS